MEISYWKARWRKGKTGWHMEEVYPNLKRYWDRLQPVSGEKVLVPMCGKSLDMCWLAERGHRVEGVEVSESAVKNFFEEDKMEYEQETKGIFTVYRSADIRIWAGDFFRMQPEWIQPVDMVYDKAALIALPQERRPAYARKVLSFCGDDTRMLLNTFEYREEEMSGPPFPVFPDELQELYGRDFDIELLHEESIFDSLPKFQQRGLSSFLIEKVYLLKP